MQSHTDIRGREVGDSLSFSLGSCGYNWDPHPLHTQAKSTSYIYNLFHLLLRLEVIRMQLHTINALLEVGDSHSAELRVSYLRQDKTQSP
jgi:hypothetical protein